MASQNRTGFVALDADGRLVITGGGTPVHFNRTKYRGSMSEEQIVHLLNGDMAGRRLVFVPEPGKLPLQIVASGWALADLPSDRAAFEAWQVREQAKAEALAQLAKPVVATSVIVKVPAEAPPSTAVSMLVTTVPTVPVAPTRRVVKAQSVEVTGKGKVGVVDVEKLAKQVKVGLGTPNITPKFSAKERRVRAQERKEKENAAAEAVTTA